MEYKSNILEIGDSFSLGDTLKVEGDKVGIGTDSPTAKLHVLSSGDTVARFETSLTSDMAIELKNSQGSMFFGLGGGEEFAVGTDADLNGANSKFVVKNSGNVGIGTTNPASKLDVNGDIAIKGTSVFNQTGNSLTIGDIAGTDSVSFIELNTAGGATVLHLDDGGHVGIGTTSPTSHLDVVGNARIGTDSEHAFQVSDDSTNNFLVLSSTQRTTASAARDIKFRSYGTDATDNVLVMDMSKGNVGIGTANPISTLDVVADSGGNALSLRMRPTSNDYSFIQGRSNDGTELIGEIAFNRTAASTGNMLFYTGNGTNSTERMRIDSAGNVGIGTTSPAYKLDVNGSLHSSNITLADGIYHEGDSNTYINFLTDVIQMSTAGNVRAYINSSGNVGIGTSSPSTKLHISGDVTGTNRVLIENTDDGTNSYAALGFQSDFGHSYHPGILLNSSTNTAYGGVDSLNIWQFHSKPITLVTSNTVRMIVTGGGNVGIGTTSPSFTLGNGLEIEKSGTSTLRLKSSGSHASEINQSTSSLTIADLSSGLMIFKTGNVESMRINSSGDVGIGTTSPAAKLDVSGGSLKVQSGDTFGYDGTHAAIYMDNSNGRGLSGKFGGSGYARNIIKSDGSATIQIGENTSLISRILLDAGSTSANGYISLQTNQSERVRIANDGDVGIGTTSPASKLDVAGDIAISGTAVFNKAANVLTIGDIAGTDSIGFIELNTAGGATVLHLDDNGHVGIGTTSPASKLHIDGGPLTISGVGSSDNTTLVQFTESTNYDEFAIKGDFLGAGGENVLKFTTDLGGGDILAMKGDGKVGIGTTSPTEELDVVGNITSDGMLGRSETTAAATGTGFASYDVLTTSGYGLYQVVIEGNPNSDGSSSYRDILYGKVLIGIGWDGSAVTKYINYIQENPDPRALYPSGGSSLTAEALFVVSGTESTNVPSDVTYTIRIKVSGYTVEGANTTVRIQKIG